MTHVHGDWDMGGYCNRLVVDKDGYGDVCGYKHPRSKDLSPDTRATKTKKGTVMSNEVVMFDDRGIPRGFVPEKISGLQNAGTMVFCTFDATTDEGKRRLYQATNDAEPLSDNLNKTIQLVDIVAVPADVIDDDGVESEVLRLILLTKDGKRYSAISNGLYSSLQNIMAIFGPPALWDAPLSIKVVEEKSRRGRKFFTAKLV